jgi:hypothetical protein
MAYKKLDLFKALKAPASNDCGGCTACCDIIGIRELGKPYYARCIHKSEHGCNVYQNRPASCADWRCGWHVRLLGDGTEFRPDVCGIMLQLEAEDTEVAIELYEVRPDAFKTDTLPKMIDIINHHYKVNKLPLTRPAIRLYAYGSDIQFKYDVDARYAPYTAPAGGSVPLVADPDRMDKAVFAGVQRGLLMPKEN